MLLFAITIMAFSSVSLGAWALSRPGDQVVRERLLPRTAPATAIDEERHLEGSLARRVLQPLAARIGRGLGAFLPQNLVRDVDHLIVTANVNWSLPVFLASWLASVLVGLLLVAYIATSGGGFTLPQKVLVAVVILPFFVILPYMYVRRLARRRQRSITRDLPDALDLLVTSVEAGLGVDAAFALVAEKSSGPLSEALSLYLKQVGLGRQRRVALAYVAERTGVPDMISLAASVGQGEELGTSLGDVLRTQAQSLRLLRRQRAQIAAQRAPVLMTIPLALCFLPAMGAVIIVPAILNFVNFLTNKGSI